MAPLVTNACKHQRDSERKDDRPRRRRRDFDRTCSLLHYVARQPFVFPLAPDHVDDQ